MSPFAAMINSFARTRYAGFFVLWDPFQVASAPGFTFSAMLAAFIYGMFLYKKPISLPRMLIAKFIVAVVCNIILGTYLLSTINGKGFIALLPGRVIKNLIQWPVDSLIFYLVAKTLEKAKVFKLIKS